VLELLLELNLTELLELELELELLFMLELLVSSRCSMPGR
jgi:hypothetical protein